MLKMKKIIVYLVTVIVLCTSAFALMGCGEAKIQDSDILRLEAEKAVVTGTPSGSSKLFTASANSQSENVTSNSKYVANIATVDNCVTWIFNADSVGTTDLYLNVSNATKGGGVFTLGAGKVITLSVNDTEATIPSTEVKAASEYCDLWQTINIEGIAVKVGFNQIVVKVVDVTGAINIDYLGINKVKASVSEHTHNLVNETISKTCLVDGKIFRKCSDCGIKYLFDTIAATGHVFGNFHYDSESKIMVKECKNCATRETAAAPESKYFGEVFEEKNEYSVRANETAFEAEHAIVDYTEGGLNNGTSPIEVKDTASGGKLVGNISVLGNFIEFRINSAKECNADLALVLANVLWTESGIGILDPMSDYVAFTVNDENVDFSFVSFPGDPDFNYYNWRYVVMKDIGLKEGPNVLKFFPVPNEKFVDDKGKLKATIPNTDVLYIYTDEAGVITTERSYDINDAVLNNDFVSEFANENAFANDDETDNFKLKSSAKTKGDLVITFASAVAMDDLRAQMEILFNGASINLDKMAISAGGSNKLIIPNVNVNMGANTLKYILSDNVLISDVTVFTETILQEMIGAELDSAYDYMINKDTEGAKIPKLEFEAEDATLTGNTNTGDKSPITEAGTASGGKNIERFSIKNNKITWDISVSAKADFDIALRMACSNWDGSGNSNMNDLSRFIIVTIDGVPADLSAINLVCTGTANWYDWSMLVMKGISLEAGKHTIEITAVGNVPNTDVLYVYSDADVTAEKYTAPTEPEVPNGPEVPEVLAAQKEQNN